MRYKWLLILRICVGLIFAISGIAKLVDQSDFLVTLNLIHFFSENINYVLSYFLPFIEITLGTMLVSGIFINYVLKLVIVLVFHFLITILIQIMRGNIIDCNCFGLLFYGGKTDIFGLLRNIILLSVSLFLLKHKPDFLSFDKFYEKMKEIGAEMQCQDVKSIYVEKVSIIIVFVLISVIIMIIILSDF